MSHSEKLAELLNEKFRDAGKHASNQFSVRAGRRFDRIFQHPKDSAGRSGSIHCFVERETGHVYKAQGINAPAKHVRFTDVETAAMNADLYGGYLYSS